MIMPDNGFAPYNSEIINMESPEYSNFSLVSYKMRNFKAFHDSGWINVNGIVLFYGSNSSGKTALHLPLLYLEKAYDNEKLQVKAMSLGELDDSQPEFYDIRNGRYSNEDVSISFKFKDKNDKEYIYTVAFPSENSQTVTLYFEEQEEDLTEKYSFNNVFFAARNDRSVDERVNNVVMAVMSELRRFASDFSYLEPIRMKPKREYQFHDVGLREIDQKGEKSYDRLYSLIDGSRVKNDYINNWIKEFGYEILWEPISNNRGKFVLSDLKNNIKTNLIDNGFGIGQSLPLIVKMATEEGKTILVDSPEAFLQVEAQSLIGDYIIDYFTNANNILIETGSEYILYRIRRRIVEHKITPSDITLYYVDTNDRFDVRCVQIFIDEKGHIARENEGFSKFFSSNYDDMSTILSGGMN